MAFHTSKMRKQKDIEEKILCLDEELNALCNNMEGVYDQLVDRLDLLKREEGLK